MFRPDIRGKPIVVLSNNDGAIVARSAAAKKLGVPDLAPYFKVESLLRQKEVIVFSSNYPLYGDMSARVMSILQGFSSNCEIYSIDECFLLLTNIKMDWAELANQIRSAVKQQTGLAVGVGIGPTKTLAKLANHVAKRHRQGGGACVLDSPEKWEWVLKRVPVTDVWGVGTRIGKRLAEIGVASGWELASADPKRIRKVSNVNLERTVEELNGRSCIALEEMPPTKKQIYCTRSFRKALYTIEEIQEAIARYSAVACEKLRKQNGLVATIQVFLHTSPHKPNWYSRSATIQLPYPTNDSRVVIAAARAGIKNLYRLGLAFTKAGVGLIEITESKYYQADLLSTGQTVNADLLMGVMDSINKRWGRGTVKVASQGGGTTFPMKQEFKSPQYTTRWEDIPVVK